MYHAATKTFNHTEGTTMFVATHAPLALLSMATAAICLALAHYAWRQRTVAGASEFGWLMIAVAWASLASTADYLLSTEALAAKVFVSQLYVIGGASASLLLLLFAVRYTHYDHWLTRGWLIVLWGGVVVRIVLALTNQWHHLYWAAVAPAWADPAAPLVFTYSTLNRTASVFTYGLLALGGLLLLRGALRAPAPYRSQAALLGLALAIPLIANLVYYLDFGAWSSIDYTPLAFGVSSLLLAWAVFRFQFLDLAPIAQDALFANLSDGVIAVNAHGVIAAANPAAQHLLNKDEQALIGAAAAAIAAPWGAIFAAALASGQPQAVEIVNTAISVACTPLRGRNQQRVGHILMLHDFTTHQKLQKELVRLNSELEKRVEARTAELQQTVAQLQTEVDERERVEAALRQMQESLADHITDLSRHLSALYEVILLGGKSLELEEVRRLTLATICNALHADAGFLLNYQAASHRFELAAQLGLSAAQVERLVAQESDWLVEDPIPRTILHLPTARDIPAAIRLPDMQACVLTAIFRIGTPVGAMGVYWRDQPSLSVEEIALFRALSDQLAVLAENVRLRQAREQALVQEERQRIARDLHDSVTQSLYALTLSADTALARLQRQGTTDDNDRLAALMQRIATASNQALREIRLLLYELRLATPDAMPLAAALQLRLEAVEQRAGIDAKLWIVDGVDIPPSLAQTLYWIAIEALNNSLKHAAAQHVRVQIERCDGEIEMSVLDDGGGIAPQAGSGSGFGLRSMAERATQVGGVLNVTNAPAGGTEVRVRLPIQTDRSSEGKDE
jgi:signal transduction histidine kinase/PAS domain-containing protein